MENAKSYGFEVTLNFLLLLTSPLLDLRKQVLKFYAEISSTEKNKSRGIAFIAALQHPFKQRTCFSAEKINVACCFRFGVTIVSIIVKFRRHCHSQFLNQEFNSYQLPRQEAL